MDYIFGYGLLVQGANFVSSFQQKYSSLENMWLFLSNVGDPRYSYTIYFPCMFALAFIAGVKVLWIAALVEWFNLLLKWTLRGDRPYWWVGESPIPDLPTLRQFPLTCETGPGNPSGHMMVTAAVWILIIYYVYHHLLLHLDVGYSFRRRLYIMMWLGYVSMLLLLGGSRIYIATHFPHQCFLGFIVGLIIGLAFSLYPEVLRLRQKQCVILSIAMVLVICVPFSVAKVMGVEPNWTVHLAIKWCHHREWIHLDTTPLFTAMRTSGTVLGLGFAWHSKRLQKATNHYFTKMMKIGVLCSCLATAQLYEYLIKLSKTQHLLVFYGLSFLLNAVFVYVCVSFIPHIIVLMNRAVPKGKFLKR